MSEPKTGQASINPVQSIAEFISRTRSKACTGSVMCEECGEEWADAECPFHPKRTNPPRSDVARRARGQWNDA